MSDIVDRSPAGEAAGSQPPTPSDTGILVSPTTSDINLTEGSGQACASHAPQEKQVPPLGVNSSVGMTAILATSEEPRSPRTKRSPTSAKARIARPAVKLCRHVMGDGVYCQVPALSGRQYCYRHLLLRGQQMRMARAIAERRPYHLLLPPLDDMHAVQAALVHVTAAMNAGLLERGRAGMLLYALQQAANNLRFLAQLEAQASSQSQPQPQSDVAAADPQPPASAAPQRVVHQYPEFETEFALPPGLDLTQSPQVAFPPPPQQAGDPWANFTAPQQKPKPRWTKEEIELEELDDRRLQMSEDCYIEQCRKVHAKIEKTVAVEMRRKREAEWEAEAARRNAKEEEKAQRWASMDAAQQRAYWEGVADAHETAERDRRQEAAQAKRPAARAGNQAETAGTSKLPETEAAK